MSAVPSRVRSVIDLDRSPPHSEGVPLAVQITPDMTVASVVDRWPETARLFARYGLSCASCAIGKTETIGQAAAGHGAGRVKLDELISDLNRFAESGKLPEGLPAANAAPSLGAKGV